MQESTCPECKEKIGGRNHRLDESNRNALEMDNAPVPISLNFQRDQEIARQLDRELNLVCDSGLLFISQ